MPIQTHVSLWIAADIHTVFDTATDATAIAAAFEGYGPIPAMVRLDNPSGQPFDVGLVRTIVNADGSRIREEMTRVERPRRQSYELSDFSGPFGLLVRAAGGDWIFSEERDGTRITWRFRFDAYPLAWPVVKALSSFFAKAQLRALNNLASTIRLN